MKFKTEILKYFQKNIRNWDIKLYEQGDIIVIVREDRILKISHQNFKSILWLTLPEMPTKAEKVRFIIMDKNRSIEYQYIFKP
ncbi:MAG: hypothetical protein WC623_07800 [Pedobacter sp.]|uniref:hypothetical protein n=1 Tax=Pedobacter sp. TaxID=1411316 RepID=UPI0035639D4A